MRCVGAVPGRPCASNSEGCDPNDVLRIRGLRIAATRADSNGGVAMQMQTSVGRKRADQHERRACCEGRMIRGARRICPSSDQTGCALASLNRRSRLQNAGRMQKMTVKDVNRFLHDEPVVGTTYPSRRHHEQDHSQASWRAFEGSYEPVIDL